MDHDDDFHEKLATEHEGRPLFAAKQCNKCRQIYPLSAFKRALTPAEARYQGYSGQRKVEIDTEHCKHCRPKRRTKLEQFTTAELKRMAERGDVNEIRVNAIEKARKEQALAVQTGAVRRRWDERRLKVWAQLLEGVQHEITALHQQKKYAKRVGNMLMLAYCEGYMDILHRLRADLKLAYRRNRDRFEADTWQGFLLPHEVEEIVRLWSALPINKRNAGMRPPGALALRPEKVDTPEPEAIVRPPAGPDDWETL